MSCAGCGGQPPSKPSAGTAASANPESEGGLLLPPDFEVVDLPREKRKAIYHDAARERAIAVLEANEILPMDNAHLPVNNKPEFDKRVAEHKSILDGILEKKLDALAKRHNLTREELARIEDEAARLRWLPPDEPVLPNKTAESPGQPGAADQANP